MGEKFGANPVNGTGSVSVPVVLSPGRNGFGPQLALSYDSGSGNGPFGFGWTPNLPAISRRTDRGLPRYDDAHESDVFVLAGAEDLVPVLAGDDDRLDEFDRAGFRVRRYRPRVESDFARIERWSSLEDPSDVHWRSLSADDVLTRYGVDRGSRIADPADPSRIFSWLVCDIRDPVGNATRYDYVAENGIGVDLQALCERHRGPRDAPMRTANRYLKRIRYGNRRPLLDEAGHRPAIVSAREWAQVEWLFEAVLDYGEHDPLVPRPDDARPWPVREDSFSTYRAGFEVRTSRLCRRVLMFHHFADRPEIGRDCLVRSTRFEYRQPAADDDRPGADFAFLTVVGQAAHRRDGAGYRTAELPPLTFRYSWPRIDAQVRTVDRESLDNLPDGLANPAYRWLDLYGEGTPGILAAQAGSWFYKPNHSALGDRVRLGPAEPVAPRPNVDLTRALFLDVDGDGRADLVVLRGPEAGVVPNGPRRGWRDFRPFRYRPARDPDDPHVRFADLNGDGRADLLVAAPDLLEWYPSLGEDGFGSAQWSVTGRDEERSSSFTFTGEDAVHVADMTGDGLEDLVGVRNGSIWYAPNLGYGRFGATVQMDDAPWLDAADRFTPSRLYLADIDGSGTSDLVYRRGDQVVICFNRSGNGWSRPRVLDLFPHLDDTTTLTVADILGNGTACLVWSSPLPADSGRQLAYVDLMGGQKPHLLTATANSMGAETLIHYVSSNRFYLQDRAAGRTWPHPLAFPVEVVERVEVLDRIGHNRFVTRYAYHDPYYDPLEREFRGFGLVDQWDTEDFDVLTSGEAPAANEDRASHVPPVHTRTWFHTGAPPGVEERAGVRAREAEYYHLPVDGGHGGEDWLLADSVVPADLYDEDEREAYRALKGSMLRREVYADDGTPAGAHPYTVTEQNLAVRLEQRRAANRHAVFFAHPLESLTCHYEREPADPRVQHHLTLEVDAFGLARREVAIGYPRRSAADLPPGEDGAPQTTSSISYTASTPTRPVDDRRTWPDDFRAPMAADVRTYELTGFAPASGRRFTLGEWAADGFALVEDAEEIPYEQAPQPGRRRRRLIEHARTLYRPDDLGSAQGSPAALLPLGTVEPLALTGTSYKLALTSGLVDTVLRRAGRPLLDDAADVLSREAGYVSGDALTAAGLFPAGEPAGRWWLPGGRVHLSAARDDTGAQELAQARRHFFLPRRFRSPLHRAGFDTQSTVDHDDCDLLLVRSTDALGNRTVVGGLTPDGAPDEAQPGNDYRVLQPVLITDPNGNRRKVALDVLGLVVGTAVMGPTGEHLGDTLDGFAPELADDVLDTVLVQDVAEFGPRLLGRATTRLVHDLFAYARTADAPDPSPPVLLTLSRETHDSDLSPDERSRIAVSVSYSDGFGRMIQTRQHVESARDAPGSPRWVVSGWQVFNNKGKPVRQYEPFFANSPRFEADLRHGVSPVLFYDPAERVVATLLPDATFRKVVFTPWRQTSWDVNDTVLGTPTADVDIRGYVRGYLDVLADPWVSWYDRRAGGALGPVEQAAADKAAVHAGTPTVVHTDVLGRPFLTESDARTSSDPVPIVGRIDNDIEGNKRAVQDGLGRVVVRWDYDMLGHHLHQISLDSGGRWILADILGKPVRTWDDRGHEIRTENDVLHRPVRSWLVVDGAEPVLAEVMDYGERAPQGAEHNLRGRLWRRWDQSGQLTTLGHDFKGNMTGTRRRVALEYRTMIDWSAPAAEEVLADAGYEDGLSYDAMSRPVLATVPHLPGAAAPEIRTTYDAGGQLDRLDAGLFFADGEGGEPGGTAFVTEVDHDARGRRLRIAYGNGAVTTYEYDPLTFRLVRLTTRRHDGSVVQDLGHTYDPVGNLLHVVDAAQSRVFFRNRVVTADRDYTYDAGYRLVTATGREHLGQSGSTAWSHDDAQRARLPQPGDGRVMARYTESYAYDAAGNLLRVRHRVADAEHGGWSREFSYDQPGAVEPGAASNRLGTTRVGERIETYDYDAHGNAVRMPHLDALEWDHKDQLRCTARTGSRRTFCTYDGAGARVRTVTEKGGRLWAERLYLGGVEIERVHGGRRAGLVRDSLHVMAGTERVALVEHRNGIDDGSAPLVQRYQLTDQLDSSVVELDPRARVITFEEYTAYGSSSYQAVRRQRQTPKRYRYCGKERDRETGLAYHGARYYAPWLCRWTSCDPAGIGDGVNLYAYVSGNPVTRTDPTGTAGKEVAATLGDLILYADKVLNRAQVGANVQKDHAISQAIIKEILGPLASLYKEGRDLTTVVETGAASGTAAARWHTLKSTLEKPIQAAVGLLQGESGGWFLGEKVVAPMAEVLKTASGAQVLSRQQYLAMLSQLGNLHATTNLEQASKITQLVEAGDAAKLTAYVEGLASSTTGVAKWTRVLRGIATSENAMAAAAKVTELAAKAAPLVSKLAPVAEALAPAARWLGKYAGPIGIGLGGLQIATAKNDVQRIDGGITVVSSALMMSKHPVALAAAGGLLAGQAIEKSLDVSKYASEAGVTVYEGLKGAGVNDTVAFVAGGAATVLATPSAIGYAAAAKVASWFD